MILGDWLAFCERKYSKVLWRSVMETGKLEWMGIEREKTW